MDSGSRMSSEILFAANTIRIPCNITDALMASDDIFSHMEEHDWKLRFQRSNLRYGLSLMLVRRTFVVHGLVYS